MRCSPLQGLLYSSQTVQSRYDFSRPDGEEAAPGHAALRDVNTPGLVFSDSKSWAQTSKGGASCSHLDEYTEAGAC